MIKKYYVFCIFALYYSSYLNCFQTLTDLQTYAAHYTENPKSDDDFWADPNFNSYHKSILPTFWQRTTRRLTSSKPLWDIKIFEKMLHDTLEQRKKMNIPNRSIAHIQVSYPANMIIWGNLEGSFHSLIRSLTWLFQQGIINNNLEIIKSDYFLVFYGSAVNRSAYLLETLTTLMLLLYRNPDKVLYVRGSNEDNQYWHNFGLKRELLTRTHTHLTGAIPFDTPISDFFNTLPLAFYISTIKDPFSLIRISSQGMDDPEIKEQLFSSFWDNPPNDMLRYYDITKKIVSTQQVEVKVIFKTEDWMVESKAANGNFGSMFGLGFLTQDHGATAWSILSGPNMAHQKYFGFDYDAFGLITVQSKIKNSTITLYNQKISVQHGFNQHETLNLRTGILIANKGIIQDTFKIGSTLGLSAGIPTLSREVIRGISTRIEKANLNQEIPGLHLAFYALDDGYTPAAARKNVIQLTTKEHTPVILSPIGAGTLESYLDLTKKNTFLTLFPVTGDSLSYNAAYTGLIHNRADYIDEYYALIDYLVNQKRVQKVALFDQDDADSPRTIKVINERLKKYGLPGVILISHMRGATSFKDQVEKLKKELPDAIIFSSIAFQVREFIREVGVDDLKNIILSGISFLGEESIRSFIRRKGIKMLIASAVPNPAKSNLEIVQNYRKEMDSKRYKYSNFSLEAYINTSILINALQHVKKPTYENIEHYLESLKDFNFKGIKLSFNANTRSIATKIWIETDVQEDWPEIDLNTLKREK